MYYNSAIKHFQIGKTMFVHLFEFLFLINEFAGDKLPSVIKIVSGPIN